MGSPSLLTLKERLHKHIKINGDQWEWVGCRSATGYGLFKQDGRSRRTHRVVYEEYIGEIPAGMFVCHRNDIPWDVTPSNLFLVTAQDNMDDKVSKDRQVRGEASWNSKLTEIQVLEIRRLCGANMSKQSIAEKYNVHKRTIYKIVYRQSWRHI